MSQVEKSLEDTISDANMYLSSWRTVQEAARLQMLESLELCEVVFIGNLVLGHVSQLLDQAEVRARGQS